MLNLPYAAGTKYDKRNLSKEPTHHSQSLSKMNKTPNATDNPKYSIIKKSKVDSSKVKKKRIIMLQMPKYKEKSIETSKSKKITPISKDQLREIFEQYK